MATALQNARAISTGDPVLITETGYSSDPGSDYLGVDEISQAKLTLGSLLSAYEAGADKTCLHELFENYQSPTMSEREHHFGLFTADGASKLAATALHNLTAVLEAPFEDAATTVAPPDRHRHDRRQQRPQPATGTIGGDV